MRINSDSFQYVIADRIPRGMGLIAILTGLIVVVGWVLELRAVVGLFFGFPTMKLNTALLFILSGLALQFDVKKHRWYWLFGSVILVIALLTLIQYPFNINFGIDEFFLQDPFSRENGTADPGRMSPATALNFAVFGLGLLFASQRRRYYFYCVIAIFTMSLLAIAIYLYDALDLFEVFVFSTMALHTALNFFLLAIGLLFTSKRHGVVQLLLSQGSGGHMIRRVLPLIVIVLVLTGLLAYSGQQAGWYGSAFTTAVTVVSNTLIMALIIIWSGLDLQNFDADLQSSETRFRMTLDMVEQGIFLVNSEGRILTANPHAQHMFDLDATGLIGRRIESLVPPDKRDMHQQLRRDYLAHPVARPMGKNRELHALRGDGTIFPVEISLSPVEIEGEQYTIAFVVDITERKALNEERLRIQTLEIELEKERELQALKSQFVSNASHELRTPLAIIASSINMVQMYSTKFSQEQIQTKLEKAQRQINFLKKMLDDLLNINKIESGLSRYEPEPIDISPFIGRIVENAEMVAFKDTRVMTRVEDGSVVADPDMLRHILVNLLSNALKYSPDDTPVTLTVTQSDTHWQFVIKDDGIGIPEEDMAKLFQPFHRAGNVGDIEGSGLGLSIVKEYVELHDGDISVTGEENNGTTVTVSLPKK